MPSSMVIVGDNMRLCPAACMFSHIALDSDIEEKSQMIIYRQLLPLAERIDVLLSDIQELQELCEDQNSKETEMVELAEQDLASNVVELNDCLKDASSILLPDHSFDAKSAVLEVQAGAGGNEASLFAEEIFNLYIGLAAQNFHVEVESIDKHQGGEGISKACATVTGLGAFRYLKYECGVHRVQRVPKASTGTKSDRLQTSTCSVAVLPVPDDSDFEIPEKELVIEYMRSSGPGGQNANKCDTACRIVHIPTGLSIKCQEFKSQAQNEKKARQQVRSFLYQQNYEEQMKKTNAFRKSQIGNMNRNEKIRTYNFTRNSVIDHRISKGTRQVPDVASLLTGKFGYEVFHSLRDKISWEHQVKGLDEYLPN